jgi:sulfatase maturation enzyme AslB (radical SAM superfamily)
MDNFCPLPFGHTVISTKGNFGICCQHYPPSEQLININQHDYKVWSESSYVKEVQDSFSQGTKHPGCNHCWNQENIGDQSLRQQVFNEYKILKVTEPTPVESLATIEIQLGNLCNLKCLMCYETDSSAILQENQQLGINQSEQQDYHWSDTAFTNLNSLLSTRPKIINIRGGEPFYNKNLLKLITDLSDRGICFNTMLHITTNATVINSQWLGVLEKFKLVRLMVSVDATDELYEYIRFPAKWNTVAKNIKTLQEYKNFNVILNAVVQNLNIGKIGSLINWAKEQNLHLHLSSLIGQKHLAITNLPPALKQQAISHLKDILHNDCPENLIPLIKTWHQQLTLALTTEFDEDAWTEFQINIGMRDQIRKNSHRNFLKY